MTLIKSLAVASVLALSSVSASAGGLFAPAGDSAVPPPPPAAVRQGSLGGVLPIVGVVGLLLLLGQTSSTTNTGG